MISIDSLPKLRNATPHNADLLRRFPDVWACFTDALRPPPDLSSSEFSEKYRKLHERYCVESPGPWKSHAWQIDFMNAVDEGIATGKNVVAMKGGQIGGTDCMINTLCRQKVRYPGPVLFLTSTDAKAEEFGRERFDLIIADMPPLSKRLLPQRSQLLVKRFTDGPLELCGGQSINKLQSTPYRFIWFDEIDSIMANLDGGGDPIKLGQNRYTSFQGARGVVAYAHPTTKDKGAGKLYYELSDQRRGHILHSCGKWFWIDWFNPDVIIVTPREGMTKEQAERDADCYQLHCPHCHARIDEAERILMLRAGVRQISTLPPEVAKTKTWIGVQAGQVLMPHISIRSIAQEWIETDCGRDEAKTIVFVNKVLGDVREPEVKKIDKDALRKLIVVRRRQADPEFYLRGTVPPWALYLTAGQDSRTTELHYAVWGWGIRQTIDNLYLLCGCLIDWGEIKRQYSLTFDEREFHVFDDLIYNRRFPSAANDFLPPDKRRFYRVRAGAHDIGYQPTQIPITRYCRHFKTRAMPCRGAAETATSACIADPVRIGVARRYHAGDAEHVDDPALIFNTYLLKQEWYGWTDPDRRIKIADLHEGRNIGIREIPRIVLPQDVDDLWLEQSKNEELAKGEKKNELVWIRKGPNHVADCNTYAHGAAVHLEPHAQNLTAEQYEKIKRPEARGSKQEEHGQHRAGDEWRRLDDPALG